MAAKTEEKEKTPKEKEKERYSDSVLSASTDHKRYFEDVFADVDFEIKLYRVLEDRKNRKCFLCKFTNEIPDEETIGLKYGGGNYFVMGINPVEDKIYSKNIYIDETFTELKKEDEKERDLEQKRMAALTGHNVQTTDPILLMKEFFAMITPMFEAVSKVQNQPPPQNLLGDMVPKVLTGATEIFTGAFKQMSGNFMKAQQELMNQRLEEDETEELTADDPKTKLLNGAVDLIKAFGNKLIESKDDKLAKSVLNDPEVQQVIQDEDLLSMVYSTCAHDKTIGKKRIDGVFKKLKIDVPK